MSAEDMRTKLGPKFSRGAELLWRLKTKLGLSNTELGEIAETNGSQVSKVLWGDLLPTVAQVGRFEAFAKKHRVTLGAGQWSEVATPDFEPPTVTEARADLAATDATHSDPNDTIPGAPPSGA